MVEDEEARKREHCLLPPFTQTAKKKRQAGEREKSQRRVFRWREE